MSSRKHCVESRYVKEYMSEATWDEEDCYKSNLTVPSEGECIIRRVIKIIKCNEGRKVEQ